MPGHSPAYAAGGHWQGRATGACASWRKLLTPARFFQPNSKMLVSFSGRPVIMPLGPENGSRQTSQMSGALSARRLRALCAAVVPLFVCRFQAAQQPGGPRHFRSGQEGHARCLRCLWRQTGHSTQVGIYVAGFPCKPYSPLRWRSRWLADDQAKPFFGASAVFAFACFLTCRRSNSLWLPKPSAPRSRQPQSQVSCWHSDMCHTPNNN